MTIKDKVDDYLEEKFPKGKDKRRGEALVLIALACGMGEENKLVEVGKGIDDEIVLSNSKGDWINKKKLKQKLGIK